MNRIEVQPKWSMAREPPHKQSTMGATQRIFHGPHKESEMVYGDSIVLQMKGFSDIRDITEKVEKIATDSTIKYGIVSVSVVGSTASVTTMEYEPALVRDIQECLERIASKDMQSHHSRTWGDDNGFSHIRATLMGPGISVPLVDGNLILGTWQQIVVIDHDNSARSRKIYVQIAGE
jgi:secondary thiamine-phosphate synthase enzyme